MAKKLVVVAIPEEQDRVWKISSEKIPHLTLLDLGDSDANPHVEDIVQFVEHAVQICQHGPFYLDVDSRGTLGPDNADVVFFSTRSWNLKWIKQFRSQLLQNENIRTAYDSTDQYNEWQPHLTLGYPATPAKKLADPLDDTVYSVRFDRIAVWVDDYSGPDFKLEWPDRELEYGDSYGALAYSDVGKSAVADILEHHGVKGMHWGIRRDRVAAAVGKVNTARKNAKFTRKANSTGNITRLVNIAANRTKQQDLPAINAKYEAKGAKTHKSVHLQSLSLVPVQRQYREEVKAAYLKRLNEVARETKSSTGNRRYELAPPILPGDVSATRWRVKSVKVAHAALSPDEFDVVPVFDADGFIVDFKVEPVEDVMAQTTELGKEFVAHQSVLDNPDLATQIKAKLQSILDDVTGDPDKDINLFGDPIIRVKLQSVLSDFYKDPNVTEAMVYSALGELAMEHHGIKGMHWGIRRGDHPSGGPQAVHPTATSKVPAGDRRKTKIKTEGGQNINAHPDAIKVAESKAKLKKSGAAALSNQELRDVANRVQLENQVSILTSRKGAQFVKRQLANEGSNVARAGVREGVKRGAKKAGVAGVVAAL